MQCSLEKHIPNGTQREWEVIHLVLWTLDSFLYRCSVPLTSTSAEQARSIQNKNQQTETPSGESSSEQNISSGPAGNDSLNKIEVSVQPSSVTLSFLYPPPRFVDPDVQKHLQKLNIRSIVNQLRFHDSDMIAEEASHIIDTFFFF